MKLFKIKYLFAIIVIAGIAWMLKDSFTQPGVKDLKGNFRETAFYRNENNTGPVIRIYAVSVSGNYWDEMLEYGNLMPHTKYGTTKVYFFKNTLPVPQKLTANEPHFETALNPNCIALYEKDGMNRVSILKSPLKQLN